MHSVREFVELAFSKIGTTIEWSGQGTDEVGKSAETGDILVRIDERYFRPTEVDLLLSNPAKAKEKLGWVHSTPFETLVAEMLNADLELVKGEMDRKSRHE